MRAVLGNGERLREEERGEGEGRHLGLSVCNFREGEGSLCDSKCVCERGRWSVMVEIVVQ